MRREVYAMATILLGTMAFTTGCASKKRHERDITNLQNQIGALQSDVARLDQAVKETETAAKSAKGAGSAQGVGTGSALGQFTQGAIYRTPTGFELPAMAIQQALKKAGYYQGGLDGKIGSKTKQALRSFQKDNGLEPDGVCGRQTWAKLESFT